MPPADATPIVTREGFRRESAIVCRECVTRMVLTVIQWPSLQRLRSCSKGHPTLLG